MFWYRSWRYGASAIGYRLRTSHENCLYLKMTTRQTIKIKFFFFSKSLIQSIDFSYLFIFPFSSPLGCRRCCTIMNRWRPSAFCELVTLRFDGPASSLALSLLSGAFDLTGLVESVRLLCKPDGPA